MLSFQCNELHGAVFRFEPEIMLQLCSASVVGCPRCVHLPQAVCTLNMSYALWLCISSLLTFESLTDLTGIAGPLFPSVEYCSTGKGVCDRLYKSPARFPRDSPIRQDSPLYSSISLRNLCYPQSILYRYLLETRCDVGVLRRRSLLRQIPIIFHGI